MKKIISMMLAIALVFTLSACSKNNTSSDVDSSTPTQVETFSTPENYASVLLVTINPQFKLYLDENNNVLAVEPVNDDAKTFSDEIDFENKSFETVIEIILEKANENGFVKENATVNFEITEQKAETVRKDDILQKAVAAAEQKATEIKINITVEAKETADNASSEETSTPSGNTSKPNNKKTSSTASTVTSGADNSTSNKTETPSKKETTTETKCNHNVKYTFDSKANTWTHTGKCTICNEYVGKNVACKDENKDNKCDLCSAKMDFGTAYLNAGFDSGDFFCPHTLLDSNGDYGVPLFLKQIYTVCVRKATAIKTDDWNNIYSAAQFESIAKSYFNIDDSVIAQLRTLKTFHVVKTEDDLAIDPIYDSEAGTYLWSRLGKGCEIPDCLGYKKTGDSEYTCLFWI